MVFSDWVDFSGTRNGVAFAFSAKCCVVDDDFDDPASEQSAAAEARNVRVFVKRYEWISPAAPAIGDAVALEDGTPFAVRSVHKLADCFSLACRQKGRAS